MPIKPPEVCEVAKLLCLMSNSLGFLILELIRINGPISAKEVERALMVLQYENLISKAPAYSTVNKAINEFKRIGLLELDEKLSGKKKPLRYKLSERGTKLVEGLHEIFNDTFGYECINNSECLLKSPKIVTTSKQA